MKVLMENWRKFVNEQEAEQAYGQHVKQPTKIGLPPEQQQQQKKGPNIPAMALGMTRRGQDQSPEALGRVQAQIKKTTGRDISVDNIKRMLDSAMKKQV